MNYYNYGGYNENKVIQYGIDDADLHILEYIVFKHTDSNFKYINDKIYYYISLETMVLENPRLKMQKRALLVHIDKLVKCGLLEKMQGKLNGTKATFYRVTNKYLELKY